MNLLLIIFMVILSACHSGRKSSSELFPCADVNPPKEYTASIAEKEYSEGFKKMQQHPGAQAKIICSGLWVTGRNLEQIKKDDLSDVNLSTFKAQVNYKLKQVRINRGPIDVVGYYQGPRRGCALEILPKGVEVKTEKWPLISQKNSISPLKICETQECKKLNESISCAFNHYGNNDRSLLVIKNGLIVSENYAPGFSKDTPQLGWSLTKSVLGTLVGLRLDDLGLDLNHSVKVHPELKDLKIGHLLQMESGLNYDEAYKPDSDLTKVMFESSDPYQYILNNIKVRSDGKRPFSYSTVDSTLLSKAYTNLFPKGNKQAYQFAYGKLFRPLGMFSALIEADSENLIGGGAFMYATPRDWAKFGLAYLNEGQFNDQQVLPKNWVKYATTGTKASGGSYGAQWWVNPRKQYFYGAGVMGQYILVYPKQNLLIIRHASRTDTHDPLGESLKSIFERM